VAWGRTFTRRPGKLKGDPSLTGPTYLGRTMPNQKNAPTNIVWIICLCLYLLALLAHFRVFRLDRDIASWAWILGFALLLIATKVRRL
jgi:hypothetical protein